MLSFGFLFFSSIHWTLDFLGCRLVGRWVGRLAGGYTTCPHVVGEDGCSLVLLRRCCVLLVRCFVFVLFFSSGEMPACYFRLSPCSVLRPGIHPSIPSSVRSSFIFPSVFSKNESSSDWLRESGVPLKVSCCCGFPSCCVL